MVLVRPLGFRSVIVRRLQQYLCPPPRANSSFPRRQWLSFTASTHSTDSLSPNGAPSEEQQDESTAGHELNPQTCFSLISDFYQPLVSRPFAEKLPSRPIKPNKTPLVVLLLTPSHIKLLEEGNQFIPDLLRQTHENLQHGQAIDVLLAAVDKISYPGGQGRPDIEAERHKKAIGYTGNGISVLLLDSETAAPDLWSDRIVASKRKILPIPRRSTLVFQFDTGGVLLKGVAGAYVRDLSISRTFKLPVANTIFHNGRVSTIQAQQWTVDKKESGWAFGCVKKMWLDEQLLKVPPNEWFTERDSKDPSARALAKSRDELKDLGQTSRFVAERSHRLFRASVPLTPITEPRVVAASMGNVIRSLFANGSSGEVMPASKELEAAVDQWISEHETEARSLEVWALITSNNTHLHHWSSKLDYFIDSGSHLHKVLSGGGGWGNRQGLLALDPELDLDVGIESSASDSPKNTDPEVERRRNLGQIVSHGDTVEFFARAPGISSFRKPLTQNIRGNAYEFTNLSSVVFGTTPSTVDVMPAPTTAMVGESKFSPCIYAWGHFGMLSEQGMSLTTMTPTGQKIQTKIDVPHALVSLATSGRIPRTRRIHVEVDDDNTQSNIPFQTDNSNMDLGSSAPPPTSEYLLTQAPSKPQHQDESRTLQETAAVIPGQRVASDTKERQRFKARYLRRKLRDKDLEDRDTIKRPIRMRRYATSKGGQIVSPVESPRKENTHRHTAQNTSYDSKSKATERVIQLVNKLNQ
ncbi:MAG: hypothetical protein Q9225_004742 [Loekoesia sp. 1 TL-2023]